MSAAVMPDVVGTFRSGHVHNGTPESLTEWRVTTGDPVVADRIFELLGGDAPQPWDTKSEETLEVFTAVKSVAIVIEKAEHLRQRMQLWSRDNKLLIDSDGEVYNDGTPDPDADLTFAERKKKAETGFGPKPAIDLVFRLAEAPELGLFKFATGAWSVAYDLAANDVAGQLEDIDGPATATLTLEEVSFDIKKGPNRGQSVHYVKGFIGSIVPAAPSSINSLRPH